MSSVVSRLAFALTSLACTGCGHRQGILTANLPNNLSGSWKSLETLDNFLGSYPTVASDWHRIRSSIRNPLEAVAAFLFAFSPLASFKSSGLFNTRAVWNHRQRNEGGVQHQLWTSARVVPEQVRRGVPVLKADVTAEKLPATGLTAEQLLEACDLDTSEVVCKYDPQQIDARFADEPLAVFSRIVDVLASFARVKLAGEDSGATLRAELSRLGPVFCKVGQTLATRPDIIGLDTSRNLGQLQDAMAPESTGSATAMETLAQTLGGEYYSKLRDISAAPVACASLAEVYRAKTVSDGVEVAVKIQRPGLERKVALDLHVMRRLLALAQQVFKIGGDVSVVVAVLDEVGAGLFAELDFMTEAEHIERFRKLYEKRLDQLGVVVPSVRHELTSQRVLVTEWIHGVAPRELQASARQNLAKKAVRCLAMQLMTDGFIHCDPHEGNLLALPDGKVALLDFGLMAQMNLDHQEAMAHGVLNIMSENYEALEDIFKGMGVLDTRKPDLRRPGVDEPFASAIKRCMTGGSGEEQGAEANADVRKRIIQDSDGADRRRAFGQLYEELSELAFKYYFTIPSYYILVMRAFVTLEGIALSADEDDSFNMYEATAPFARRKLLTPKTKGGRALLKAALTTRDGRRALRAGLKLPRRLRWMGRIRKALRRR